MGELRKLRGSFRDPSGFMFVKDGILFRQVNKQFADNYELLLSSGLYDELTKDGLLLKHSESKQHPFNPKEAYKVLRPEKVEFISYPNEWSFSQLQDAALLTLELQTRALARGMWIKDANATNIQFHNGRPLLIDSLSFEKYPEGSPWIAYRQFCQHFLAPLALMALVDIRLGRLLVAYIDGIPLDLASRLLPMTTRFNLGLATNIHLHAAAQDKLAGKVVDKQRGVSKFALLALIDQLTRTIKNLHWVPKGTPWADYYDSTNYSRAAESSKLAKVKRFVSQIKPKVLWDIAGNNGYYLRKVLKGVDLALCLDMDPSAVERNYLETKSRSEKRILPLLIDLTNPTPAVGWDNKERTSLFERGKADAVLALAIVHHLAISNNLPFKKIAETFKGFGEWLIIEFVPKQDSQVQKLLASRKDIFDDYHVDGFEVAFSKHFKILRREKVANSNRILYLMKNKAYA